MAAEPVIDPVTGKPKEGGDNNSPGTVQISTEDWAKVNARLDSFDKIYQNIQPQQAPAAPAAPAGPTLAEQLSQIDTQIESIDTQIDAAVSDGKPVSKLMRERDKLTKKQIRLEVKHEDIDPAFATGIDTINQLSDTVTRGSMPYLNIVQKDYDGALESIPADQRMNPKMRQAAYNIAVGQNITKIMEAENEKALRAQNEPDPPPPGSNSRSSENDQDTVPKPETVLSKDTLKALKMAGRTVDEDCQKRGYKNWEDFWNKTGKSYFAD